MSFDAPGVQIFQQFKQYPSEITDPLRACLIGPEYGLHRYTVASEKAKVASYDAIGGNNVMFDALGRAAGGVVDQLYTKVYIENGLLEYYRNAAGNYVSSSSSSSYIGLSYSGSPDGGNSVLNVIGTANKIKTANVNLKGNGASYPLDAAFFSRDVAVGDHVRVSGVIGATTYTTDARVSRLEADPVASNVSAAAPGSTNAATNGSATAASAITKGGTVNTATIAVTATSYNGLVDGVLSETYTVKVRRGSTGGDARTAVLDVTSASGLDNITGLTFATSAFTGTFALGNNGATFTVTIGAEADLTTGQTFTSTITQQFFAPTATANAGANYTGLKDTTYILTVLRGGAVTDTNKPVLSVSTTTGYDAGPAVTVTTAATPYAVGNYGVTASFAASSGTLKFRTGDQYFIPVTAAGVGPYRTIVLDNRLDDNLLSTVSQSIDLTLSLSIPVKTEITSSVDYSQTWTQTSTGITLVGGIRLFSSAWRSGAVTLPLIGGDIYVHWRELVQTHADGVHSVDTLGDLTTVFATPIDPDNHLAYAANKALENANGTSIRVIGIASNDDAGYLAALSKIETRDDCYFIVPLTSSKAIQDEIVGHVHSMSTPTLGQWRVAVLSSAEQNPATIVQFESDGATLVNATTSGKVLRLSNSSGVSFLDAGVLSGDQIRLRIGPDASGNVTYESFTVDTVDGVHQVTLTVAPSPALTVAQPIQIWRSLTSEGSATQISTNCGVFASSRVYDVQPARIASGGVEVKGYYLAAAIAGLKSGVVPHQGLTNVPLTGFDNANNIVKRFNLSQLNRMANSGVWIVTHDLKTGAVYTRQQVSTDPTDVNTREMSVVANVDSISFYLKSLLKKFVGRSNVTPSLIQLVETEIEAGIAFLKSSGFAENIGGQLIDATLVSIAKNPALKDRIVITLELQIPYPLNTIIVNLVI